MTPESAASASRGTLARVLELIRQIGVALLTTRDGEGALHTRPIQTLGVEDHGTLWFFTDAQSEKADELRADTNVSLGYADTAANRFVAVSGVGSVRRDSRRAKDLWRIEQRAFYPDGPDDRRLGLLRVRIERAEYWIAPGRTSYLFTALKAATTGTPAGIVGENRRLSEKSKSLGPRAKTRQ